MKPAKQFAREIDQARGVDILAMVEARDAESRAEEHEAREALFALERAAHKKELREARASVLLEAAESLSIGSPVAKWLRDMADRAEKGES
jgi:hypothetical protein